MGEEIGAGTEASIGCSRRRFLQVAAVGGPVTALASARTAPLGWSCQHFTHLGHQVLVTRHGRSITLRIDGRVVPDAVQVRNDGVLASPDLLPYSDAAWGTDVRALVRRLIERNGVDYIIF